ncbi:aldo/keto reductase family protein [Atractiella rhizophila]|nr:aldo/keto reductase family protein [Atractiella rhizophila]
MQHSSRTNPLRRLGRNGPLIPALGYGVMGLSPVGYGKTLPDANSIALLKAVLDKGCTHIDSSNAYGFGHNETLIGEVLKDPGYKKKAFVATKFGLFLKDAESGIGVSGTREHVRKSVDESLERLGVNTISLYYQHRVDRSIPIEETWSALKELKNDGKVNIVPINALEIEFSPWTPDIRENGILDVCRELGIAIVCYAPLGRGFLSGAYKSPADFEPDDWRLTSPRFQGEAFQENLKLVESLKELATKKGCTPSQLTLAWVLAQGDDFFAIPGTKNLKYLEENLGALDVELSQEELEAIEQIIATIKVVGARFVAVFDKEADMEYLVLRHGASDGAEEKGF